ncbi:CIS tube protein [Marinigracilibium pacificum]|uniref:Peptidoglycan-binding protein n=1 Tax=Marinigracilibium pacificum TaxID=2729599 RepID=A0A848IVG9_9BACT|nr:peptidoglycan-binding protein [Marinigracilibium pacificum]NMM48473.1 peptidoglycan-binding protein [Marinigracilibium pacificum]
METEVSALKKLEIISYSTASYDVKDELGRMSVYLNPNSITNQMSISYNTEQPKDTEAAEQKFEHINSEKIQFEIWFDGTGSNGEIIKVSEKLKELRKLCYDYIGEAHETPYVGLKWGESLAFNGRMESMNVTHTLFAPNGDSLRAKVNLGFVSARTLEEQAKRQNRSSPDLSHLITVMIGDSLPSLCSRIYGDPNYYLQVAEINGLTSFRDLEPGMELHFPPLKK